MTPETKRPFTRGEAMFLSIVIVVAMIAMLVISVHERSLVRVAMFFALAVLAAYVGVDYWRPPRAAPRPVRRHRLRAASSGPRAGHPGSGAAGE